MPLTLTQLFIATSEKQDIKMTARVFSSGSAPVESQSINVAWANVGLSGGIYYWSTIPNPPKATQENAPATPPNYILLDKDQTSGTAIYRYDFTNGTAAPTVTWTDDGGPKSTPPYQGAPAAVNNNVGKGHCIGCHAISNDGKYMALTIGGSASDAANTTILDIGQQTLININPAASTDPNSSPTANFSDYWKKFRVEGVAAENTWGPNNDRMISMFRSKLYQTNVTISGTTGTVTRAGAVVPSWTEYASDPFWSPDGSLFVFTSFDQPDIGTYNTDGLNGDMKRRGKIAIASADMMGVHDDAHDLVPRMANVTSFYPSISNDSKLVVFNQSTCGTDPDVNRSDSQHAVRQPVAATATTTTAPTLWIVNPTRRQPGQARQRQRPGGQRQLVAALQPGQGQLPRRADLLDRVLVAPPVRVAGELQPHAARRRSRSSGSRRCAPARTSSAIRAGRRSGCPRRIRSRPCRRGTTFPSGSRSSSSSRADPVPHRARRVAGRWSARGRLHASTRPGSPAASTRRASARRRRRRARAGSAAGGSGAAGGRGGGDRERR